MKNKPLQTVISVVSLLCVAGLAGTAWHLMHKRPAAGARTERLPHDAALVFTLDVAQARAWPELVSLHHWLMEPGADASPGVHEASQRYHDLITDCGFDPWVKVDAFTIGVDRAVLTGQAESDVVTYVDGTFTPAQARQCLNGMATRTHRTLQSTDVSHHPVLTFPHADGGNGHTQQVALLERSALVADQAYMVRALAIADGSAPGMPTGSSAGQMLQHLGMGNILNLAVDVTALRAHNAHSIDSVVDAMAHDNPTIQHLDALKQVTTLGLGVRPVSPTQSLVLRLDLPEAAGAASVTTALTGLIQARRGDLTRALDQGQATLGMMQATSALSGGEDMSHQATAVNAGIDALRQLIQHIQVTTEANSSVVSITFTPQQVTALDGAVRAMADVLSGVSRSARGIQGLGMPPPGGLGAPQAPGLGNGLPGLGL